MKLILAIINDEDTYYIIDALKEKKYSVTKLARTGGFLRSGNTTLICGVEDEKVDQVISIIEENGRSRKQLTPTTISTGNMGENFAPYPMEVNVGGATIFVLNVDEFRKV